MIEEATGAREWTADSLAAELYRRQGYFAMRSDVKREVGEMGHGFKFGGVKGELSFPLRVIGPATVEQVKSQGRLVDSLIGMDRSGKFNPEGFLYLVEAAD